MTDQIAPQPVELSPVQKFRQHIVEAIFKKVLPRITQMVVSGVVGIVTGPNLAPYLDKYGLHVDKNELALGIASLVAGGLTYLWHYAEPYVLKQQTVVTTITTQTTEKTDVAPTIDPKTPNVPTPGV